MKKMANASDNKIMFVVVSMAGGGAERVVSIVANNMVKQGAKVSILMIAGDAVEYDLAPEIEIYSAGSTSGGKISKRIKRVNNMRSFMKKHRDYTMMAFEPSPSFFAWISSLGLGMKLCVSERNDPAACKHPKLRNFVYNRAKLLVCQTRDALNSFPTKLQKKAVVIPNPVRSDLPDKKCCIMAKNNPYFTNEDSANELDGDRIINIAAVGRLWPQKNYPLLLEAYADMRAKLTVRSKLHIYGKGDLLEALQKQCEELNISDDVVWEGFCTDVLNRIIDADMYVLSSDYEGISNALIEAMALGLPVISTDCPIGGSRMCIEDGINGLLVPCRDKAALSEAMLKLATDMQYAAKLGINAMKIREEYSEEVITSMWMNNLSSKLQV